MKGPDTKPIIKFNGVDGNAFSVMGHVKKALKRAGADKEYIDQYINEAIIRVRPRPSFYQRHHE